MQATSGGVGAARYIGEAVVEVEMKERLTWNTRVHQL
jgi:hypothetical protein